MSPDPSHSRSACRLLALVLASAATPAVAQRHDGQLWFQANTVVPLARDVRVTLEQIARGSERQDGLYTTEFGGIVEYQLIKGVQIGFGYRRVDGHNDNTTAGEDRLRQHVVATFGRIAMRLRLDERFSAGGAETGFRIRPLIRYNHPLNANRLALFISHESFFLPNSTAWGQRRGYERMRNLAGLVVPVARGISADVGYLNQYRFARGGTQAQMEHALSVQLTINLAALPAASMHD
jgi:hypothetical protein